MSPAGFALKCPEMLAWLPEGGSAAVCGCSLPEQKRIGSLFQSGSLKRELQYRGEAERKSSTSSGGFGGLSHYLPYGRQVPGIRRWAFSLTGFVRGSVLKKEGSLFTRTPVLLAYIQQGSQPTSPEPRPTSSPLPLTHPQMGCEQNNPTDRAGRAAFHGGCLLLEEASPGQFLLGSGEPPLSTMRGNLPEPIWRTQKAQECPGQAERALGLIRPGSLRAGLVALDQDVVSHGLPGFRVAGEAQQRDSQASSSGRSSVWQISAALEGRFVGLFYSVCQLHRSVQTLGSEQ